ncbi:MAG: elongation factor Ts [Patescibacteria group bacterium]
MFQISMDDIKRLRELTGGSISLCKKALEESGGDMEKAIFKLKKSSEALAEKKSATRTAGAGLVEAYIHGNKKVGVLLELRCETDFVARNSAFQVLAHDIALHIAGMKPLYVSKEQIPDDARKEAEAIFSEEALRQAQGKPDLKDKILQGKLDAHFRDTSLLSQQFVKDQSITIEELIKQSSGTFGEKIEVAKFERFEV